MAKIFLTVVGTGDYKCTDYRLGDNVCSQERFVQKALLRMLSESGERFDRIVFFLTEKAKSKNWEEYRASRTDDKGIRETDEGLHPFLEKNFPGIYEVVDICDGVNESEHFELFNSMYDAIGEGDEITFDVTHGFRFLPLLFFPLMSYAKELKRIKIKRICYGLLNNDGAVSDIIDLKRYDEILDCANAAHSFIKTGNSSEIVDVIKERMKQLTDSEKAELGKYNSIAVNLKDLSNSLLTCQGGNNKTSIFKKAAILMKHINMISGCTDEDTRIFDNLISHAVDSVNELARNKSPYELGMDVVRWYIDKGLILQAYTGLRECITTFCCCIYAPEQKYDDHKFRQAAVDRAITASIQRDTSAPTIDTCLNTASELLSNKELTEKQRKEWAACFVKIVCHVDPDKLRFIQDIVEKRNQMNHFGMRNNANNVKLEDVEKHFAQTLELFRDIEERHSEILTEEEALAKLTVTGNGVFINFSNHPSSGWTEKQIIAAGELCNNGGIEDLPFPSVPADASDADIEALADRYSKQIMEMSPSAVMCMGEFGVCHKVVETLKNKGIIAVYSCSERCSEETVTDNGIVKNSVFNFVQFRRY